MSWPKRNRARRLLATIGSCSLAILMTAGVVWASEGGQSMWPDFWQRVLNFAILMAVLIFVFKKLNVKAFFTKRTESIANTLNELEAKKKEAEKTYEEYKQKLAQLDKETDRILQEYIEQGEREKAKIIANAARGVGFSSQRIVELSDSQEAIALLEERLHEDDVVLVKGSRGMAMEKVVRKLQEWCEESNG